MNSKFLHHNMSRFKKRERTQNWAYEEKRFLLELCRKDMKIIENKRLDSSLTAIKNRAWRIIHQQFTATFGTDRDCNRLKEQWRRMKACTRAEMIDYQHRIARYGQEIADRKRPNPFSFEIWEFMQEAKRACKSEAMDDIDYSKMKLTLEETFSDDLMGTDDIDINNRITDGSNGDDDDRKMSFLREQSTQNMCEVEIKEEVINDYDNYSTYNNNSKQRNYNNENSNQSLNENDNSYHDNGIKKSRISFNKTINNSNNSNINNSNSKNVENQTNLPSLSINNVAATLDTLNMLKNQINFSHMIGNNFKRFNNRSNSNSNNSSAEPITLTKNNGNDGMDENNFKQYFDMQSREHSIRMQILQIELETAKFNRDTAEINRQMALKKLNETGSPDNS